MHAPAARPHTVRDRRAVALIVAEEESQWVREEVVEIEIMRPYLEHHRFPPPHNPSSSFWMEVSLNGSEPSLPPEAVQPELLATSSNRISPAMPSPPQPTMEVSEPQSPPCQRCWLEEPAIAITPTSPTFYVFIFHP